MSTLAKRLCLYLASASPRRVELLRGIGLHPIVVPQDVLEARRADEPPRDMVQRLAEAKARSALETLSGGERALILAADTAVVVDGDVLGKPRDAGDAAAMLRRLRGREHEVLTGVFLLRTDDSRSIAGVDATRVFFRRFDDATLDGYVGSQEPFNKAGAYGIQGLGAALVERIEGSWSNVVGLPIESLVEWIGRLGIDLAELRRR